MAATATADAVLHAVADGVRRGQLSDGYVDGGSDACGGQVVLVEMRAGVLKDLGQQDVLGQVASQSLRHAIGACPDA